MFTNKHVVLAMIVAPILAIIAYFGIDAALSEKPMVAEKGETYQLAARSNCRYTSGLCSLENGDFKLKLKSESLTETTLSLTLTSEFPLQGARMSLGESESAEPIAMSSTDNNGMEWAIEMPAPQGPESMVRLVVKSNDSLYYGESETTFVEYKTFFTESQDK
ncbi:hypothetical protein CS022_16065 [Veronia nyctiphanis]|uniref:Uncharacterized protein n=1 Tax=Veronia nyctiphanis TaxID=1278244 RepID=A0A4Q0YND6_9GAMM|nr:hypothetical protein [Veronia nyctiphanis]RXJ72346.1 hypothetical protein CS022_16065 [Veronia nyctiphanis]